MRRWLLGVVAVAACAGPPTLGQHSAELGVSPSIYDFGAVEAGQTSNPRLFVVSATIGEFDYLEAVNWSCPDFNLDLSNISFPAEVSRDCNIDPNAHGLCVSVTARFTGSFSPSFAGPQSCQVELQMQSAGIIPLSLSGTGTAPPIGQELIAPGSSDLAFGDVVVGSTSAALPITLRSTGSGDLTIQAFSIDATDMTAFVVDEVGSNPVAPGDDHTWNITCKPGTAGLVTGTATIATDAPGSPLTIGLACNGIQSDLAVDRSPVQFAETLIGQSRAIDVTLFNTGSAALTLSSVTASGNGFSTTDPGAATLNPGDSVGVTVSFQPDAADTGTDVHGTLTVQYDSGSRAIDLIGPARDASLNVTPGNAIDLGTICAGQSREQLFVAVNPGSGATSLDAADVTGDGFTLGLIAPTSLPAPLAARGASSASLRVAASPPVGDVTGTLTLTTGIPGAAPTAIPVHARGQAGGIGASPDGLDFGGVVVGEPSGGRSVRLSNCDPAPLDVTTATVTGAAASEFVAVSAERTLPLTLASGDSLLFFVEMRPTSGGDKVAALEIAHGSGTTTIPLTGLGVGDEPGGGGGVRGSYYACSTGGDGRAGLGLVLLALAIAARRRR